jgi:hypothetical protein
MPLPEPTPPVPLLRGFEVGERKSFVRVGIGLPLRFDEVRGSFLLGGIVILSFFDQQVCGVCALAKLGARCAIHSNAR